MCKKEKEILITRASESATARAWWHIERFPIVDVIVSMVQRNQKTTQPHGGRCFVLLYTLNLTNGRTQLSFERDLSGNDMLIRTCFFLRYQVTGENPSIF